MVVGRTVYKKSEKNIANRIISVFVPLTCLFEDCNCLNRGHNYTFDGQFFYKKKQGA
jgi:hypothetical protein